MRLAEALLQRADAQKRLAQLRARIVENARHQEGADPAEDPRELLAETDRVAGELAELIRRINRTNSRTAFDARRSMTDALADRDVLMLRRSLHAEAAKAASVRQDRFMRSELRLVSALDVPALQVRVDELSKEYRELDARIQELNWATDVVD